MTELLRHRRLLRTAIAVLAYWAVLLAVVLLGPPEPLAGTVLAILLLAGLPLLSIAGLQIWQSGSVRAGELALRDELTGLGNRRAFVSHSRSLLSDALPGSLSLVLVDVDGLKAINDHCGHQAGDELLVEVGRHLASTSDTVYRIGGDEFAILVSRSAGQSMTGLLGSLKPFHHAFKACGHEHPVNFSYGFAAHRPRESFEDLFKRADGNLREFKERLYASGQFSDRRARPLDSLPVDNDGRPEGDGPVDGAGQVVSIFSRRPQSQTDARRKVNL